MKKAVWLICGGRAFADKMLLDDALSALARCEGRPSKIVHGGAAGADMLAMLWAERQGIPVAVENADWERYGLSAGPRRNQRMLDTHKPDLVIAFPGGSGTADMVRRSMAANVAVMKVEARS